jgi:hypothetical protein
LVVGYLEEVLVDLEVVLDGRRDEALVVTQQPPPVELRGARNDVDRLDLYSHMTQCGHTA